MPVEEGKKAPGFTAPVTTGETVSLSDYAGKPLVLYFYPKDLTPGCTEQACNFRDAFAEIKKAGAEVLGVSPDSVRRHVNFTKKHTLNFPLLSDPDHAICEAYDVWKRKTLWGHKYMGVERSTFLIGPDGKIVKAWRNIKKIEGHVAEVMQYLNEL